MWRSEDEILEVVQRRAAAALDRRRALLTGSTAALVLVAALAVATVRGGDEGGSQQVRVAAPAGGGAVTTTVFLPPTSIDSPPISSTPLPITSPTTAVVRTTTTVRSAPAPTTTVAPAPTTTRPLPAVCTPDEVQASVSPSKTTFATGEAVNLTATLRNTSGRDCGHATDGWLFTLTDAAGASQGADRGASSHVDCVEGAGPCGLTWSAGTETTFSACWDQLRRVGDTFVQAPPGRYTATATWSGRVTSPVSASATVDVRPPPAGQTPPAATC